MKPSLFVTLMIMEANESTPNAQVIFVSESRKKERKKEEGSFR